MLYYPYKAITTKTISQFRYSLYKAITVNMLKYNNDSSSVLRLLSCFTDTTGEVAEDLPYEFRLNFKDMEFVNVDRLSGFNLDMILDFEEKNEDGKYLFGYSVYTDKWYQLGNIEKRNDFIRHSLPIDSFLSSKVEVGDSQLILSYPYKKESITMDVRDSAITIRPISGFSLFSQETNDPISLTITGLNTYGKEVSEIIEIEVDKDYVTSAKFSRVDSIMPMGTLYSVEVEIFPYIKGRYVDWDQTYIDRDMLDEYNVVLTVNRESKQLTFNTIREVESEYPLQYEPVKTVDIALPSGLEGDEVTDEFIDVNNKLLYIAHKHTVDEIDYESLTAYPLIIPTTDNNTLDSVRSGPQELKIEYVEDSVNEKFVLYIFPSSKTNNVDFLNIIIDGVVWQEDILLDLIRENLETNRIEIPFSDLSSETTLVEFRTYGDVQSSNTIKLDRTKLKHFWTKDLNVSLAQAAFTLGPAEFSSVSTIPCLKSSRIPYLPLGAYGYGEEGYGGDIEGSDDVYSYGGLSVSSGSNLLKLSGVGNVTLGGIKIVNIFDSFYYDEDERLIVTSDTITHIRGE